MAPPSNPSSPTKAKAKAESPKKTSAKGVLDAALADSLNEEIDTITIGEGPDGEGPYDDIEDPLLASLTRPKKKIKNPNMPWDGKVAGMTLKEYKARKWSVDACYSKIQRGGPSFSMRPGRMVCPASFVKKNKNFQVGDVFRSMRATQPEAPSCSMGVQVMAGWCEKERSQGPAEYGFKSSLDPSTHPTFPKNRGARFGSENLEPRDPGSFPAPGNYDVECYVNTSSVKRAPSYICGGREAWAPRSQKPSAEAGEYHTKAFEGSMKHGKLTPLQFNMQGKTYALDPPLGQRSHQTPAAPHYGNPGAWPEKVNPNKPNPICFKQGSESRGLR